ncbi:MAG: hypothetical protein ABIG61_16365 [Planctomycetota bacterium]
MKDVVEKVSKALAQVKVIDPHCHLRLEKPSADNLADILLYHHVWIELVSAGMDRFEVTKAGLPHEVKNPEIEPFERVRRCLKYLPKIKTTTLGLLIRWILKDLYGVEELTQTNLDMVFEIVQSKAKDPSWQEKVLRDGCGIEASITVELGQVAYSDHMLIAREFYLGELFDDRTTPLKVLTEWEKSFGAEIGNAQDCISFWERRVKALPLEQCKLIGLWIPAYLTHEGADGNQATRIIKKIKNRQGLSRDEKGNFCYFVSASILDILRETAIRIIQLGVGAEVLPPHCSITEWCENFCGSLGRFAKIYEDFHFIIMFATDVFTQDIGILAKHIPNISVSGYWWHTLYPYYIRKALETRLDMVPINKIIGYFSDAYHAEWCYPKLKLVKQVLGELLVERIQKNWYTTEMALDIINKLLYENPKEILKV